MSKLTNAEKDKLDNTCGNLRVTKLGTHVKTLEDFVNEGVLDTRANTVVEAINELYGMIVNKDCEGITIPPPGFFTLFGNDEDGKLYCYYNDKDHPPLFRHVETPGELEGTLYLYIADPEGDNHFEMEIGHYIAVRHLDNYYTKSQCDAKYPVTVEKQSTATSGYAATYVVKQNGSQVGTKIDIPKDFFLKGGSVKTCTTANNPVQGYAVGDKYLDMEINVQDGTATTKHMYILLRDLAPLYSADESTLTLSSNNVFSVKNGGISSTKLADNAVTTAKIAGNAVTNDKISSVAGSKVIDSNAHSNIGSSANSNQNSINTAIDTKISKLATKEQVDKIIAGDIDLTGYLKDDVGTVKTTNIAANAVTSAKIADETIINSDIANYSVTNLKLEGHSLDQSEPSGYLKLMKIKVKTIYQDSPLKFEIYCRGYTEPTICNVKFVNTNSTDPGVSSFTTKGFGRTVYLYKESASTWNVIVQKYRYDAFTVTYVGKGEYNTCEVSGMEELLSELPTSTTTNPLIAGDYIGFTSTEKTKLSGIETGATRNTVSDSLTDSSTTNALSSNQGKVLKGLVDGKSPNDHNHDSTYIKKTGGVSQHFNGNIIIPSASDATDNDATGKIPFAGHLISTTYSIEEFVTKLKSFMGGIKDKDNKWWNVISARQTNGGGSAGENQGLLLKTRLESTGDLIWNKQSTGSWGTGRTILDSNNYSNYANKTTVTDNLTTDSSTNALSAKQGKWLYDNKASSSHAHGNISNEGAIGTAENKPLITGTDGVISAGSFGTSANTFCQGNDSRITNAVKSACKIGFGTSSSAPGDAMNLSVAKGNPLYAFVRDANGNVPTGLAGGAFLFNGSPRSVTINSNGVMSLTMNTAGTFVIHAIVSDGDGYQVAAGFCRITVS